MINPDKAEEMLAVKAECLQNLNWTEWLISNWWSFGVLVLIFQIDLRLYWPIDWPSISLLWPVHWTTEIYSITYFEDSVGTKYCSKTAVLQQMQWWLICFWPSFKILAITFKALSGLQSSCLLGHTSQCAPMHQLCFSDCVLFQDSPSGNR